MESNNVMPENEPVNANENAILTMNVPTMIKGLTELGSFDIEDFDLNVAISEAASKLNPIERAYMKSASALIKKHVEVSEKGVPKTEGEGPYMSYVYKSVQDKETYLAEMQKLNNTEVKINTNIKRSQLRGVKGLKALTMMKLGVLIENDEVTK